MKSPRGYLALLLHAHLPYVRHPEHEEFLEEDWLYEAITETYIPLLKMMELWVKDGIDGRITMSLTPTLCEMLKDGLLAKRYAVRLERLVQLAEREVRRTKGEPEHETAEMYLERLADARERYEDKYQRDLIGAFRSMQEAGVLEIIASAATHAYLPFLSTDEAYVRAQLRVGIQAHRHHFGRNPPGFWLPECGYATGLDTLLADEGVCYFVLDSHGLLFAEPPPVLGTFAPIVCPSGVLSFARDPECSKQVWSADEGYPGDGRYREFYRDIGYDLSEELLTGFLQPTGERKNVGIKYHRITAREVPLHEKELYDRWAALGAVDAHASDFVRNRCAQVDYWNEALERPPIVTAPFDAELFGHWWYEGPEFLDEVVRKTVVEESLLLVTPSEVIKSGQMFQQAQPAASSWGYKGYGEVWCNDKNDWVWRDVHSAAEAMTRAASERPTATALERRALNQMARELVLASASDWPFIMTMGTAVGYAERRVRDHISRFNDLLDEVERGEIIEDHVAALEAKDNIFQKIDYRDFSR